MQGPCILIRAFDKYYSKAILFGIVGTVWFAALCHAAHDIWAAAVLFTLGTLLTAVFCIGRLRDQRPIKLPLAFTLSMFLLALGFSKWHSCDLDTFSLELWGWIFIVLFYFLFVNAIEETQDAEQFLALSGLVVVPLTLLCIWQWITGQPVHAMLINSAVLAGFTLYWTLFFWTRTLDHGFYKVAFLSCVIALTLTQSWGALVSVMIGFTLLYWDRLIKLAHRYEKTAFFLVCTVTVIIVLLLSWKTHRHTERLYYWLAAFKIWRHEPWTGVGLGGFATVYPYFKIGAMENSRFAHSFLFQTLSETGVVGSLTMMGIAAEIAFLRLKSPADLPSSSTFRVIDITLLMILCFSLISIHMDFLLNKLVFFLFLSLSFVPRALRQYHVSPLWIATAGICVVLVSPLWMSLVQASRLYVSGMLYESRSQYVDAARDYQNAITLEPFHADSYWRLSRLHEAQFNITRSPRELDAALAYLQQAVRFKKSALYMNDMMRLKKLEGLPTKTTPQPSS
jgi:hypothetical protein